MNMLQGFQNLFLSYQWIHPSCLIKLPEPIITILLRSSNFFTRVVFQDPLVYGSRNLLLVGFGP